MRARTDTASRQTGKQTHAQQHRTHCSGATKAQHALSLMSITCTVTADEHHLHLQSGTVTQAATRG
eukprot:3935257-Rhodomonas_salina.2